MAEPLSPGQLRAASILARACSALSLLGSLFVIVTFCMSSAFHKKPINRLVFYACFGNIMINVGTLMSRSYLDDIHSPGCQLQGFLMQMFLSADAYWALAMAVNVYLTFYRKFDAVSLRRMEIPYIFLCYGIPMISSLVFLFVKNSHGTKVYGNALLWCWISKEWQVMRIATVYGPIWFVILVIFSIYICVGVTIYKKRKQLQNFHSSQDPVSISNEATLPIQTTEVRISSKPASNTNNGLQLEPLSTHTTSISAAQTRRRHQELNKAAWSYAKCAMLFFTAILITWIPSSANRLYSVIHDGEISVPLTFMSAFVIPLQGFWNGCIYALTSWAACKNFWNDLRQRRKPTVIELIGGMPKPPASHARQPRQYPLSAGVGANTRRFDQSFQSTSHSSKFSKPFDTESAKELSPSRSTSADGRDQF